MALRSIKKTSVRNRQAKDPSVPKTVTPAVITTIEAIAPDTIRVTFDATVFRNKMPQFTAGSGRTETVEAMTRISDSQWEFTFSGDVAGSTLTVKESDPGIRTVPGGFVPAGVYAIPTVP